MVDGNTTDGDGGALYADEDGDVTVIDSLIDGSDADGPGGAIFTLDGDVAVLGSTLNGNRADDRGGAISGEADVLVVNSTIARNLAVAHAGGGVWARGNLMRRELDGHRQLRRGRGWRHPVGRPDDADLARPSSRNIAPVGGDIGAPAARRLRLDHRPAGLRGVTGDTIPTDRSCRVYDSLSRGYNFYTEDSCELETRDRRAGRRTRSSRSSRTPARVRADAARPAARCAPGSRAARAAACCPTRCRPASCSSATSTGTGS